MARGRSDGPPRNLAAATARAALGEAAFAEAFTRGQMLGVEEAVALALERAPRHEAVGAGHA